MLKPKIAVAILNNTIDQLKFLDHDITITISTYNKEFDSFTTMELHDTVSDEMIPHRILTSHFIVNGKPCMIQVRTSMVDNNDLIKSITKVQVILLLLLLAGLAFINRSLSKRIWKPFYITLGKLGKYKVEQHESLALSKSSVNEFNDLNKSLEELTDRTHQTYLSQKEFTENASHEMQTPLAVFQSKLELLMQTSPLSEEQAQLMDALADASQRMARLNKSLLLITKIENNQFAEKESLSLKYIIEYFIKEYQLQASQKNISIHLDLKESVIVEGNKALIEIVVGNLLGNAIRHNYAGGIINIQLNKDTLAIENTGKPASLNESRIFQRFQKDSADSNSIGLGLEMVKKICNRYHYTISYRFSNNLHNFTIRFNNF
jgi:signal transduction histidine kinase